MHYYNIFYKAENLVKFIKSFMQFRTFRIKLHQDLY